MAEAVICRQSGYLAGAYCPDKDTVMVVQRGLKSIACPYHQLVHTDKSGMFRVNSNCYEVDKMRTVSWFILPPLMEWYYRKKDPSYQVLPPVMEGCRDETIKAFEIVYPEWDSHVVIPVELDGTRGKLIMEVAHRDPTRRVFWHLDEQYLGETRDQHQLAVDIVPGIHLLSVVDQEGNREQVRFEVLGMDDN